MLEDALSFEAVLEIQDGDPTWKRVAYTAINWVDTNKRGMLFGILLGAAFLSIIRMLRQKSVNSSVGNTLIGVAVGAPLGVCVNCAAPVAKGMHDGGARLETTIAAMVSSPTLNVIVLTMTFSILPAYLALTKVLFTLIFLLVFIPLISRTLLRSEQVASVESATCDLESPQISIPGETWLNALGYVSGEFLRNLWYIARTTVPLMLLAGVLGSAVAVLAPVGAFAEMQTPLLGAVLVSAVGLFLPVPVAFDVVLSAVLLAAGLPVFYVMILLFVLGIFSCYSAFIVATTISKRSAAVLCVVLMTMGIAAGGVADFLHDSELRSMISGFGRISSSSAFASASYPEVAGSGFKISRPATQVLETPVFSLSEIPDAPRLIHGSKLFTRMDGDRIGLESPKDFSVEDFWPPFYNGRGIASSDMNGDGWVDVLVATERGPRIYENTGDGKFVESLLAVNETAGLNTFVVAPVDLNDDGWLDLFFSTYRNGAYYLLSESGSLKNSRLHRVSVAESVVTQSAAFGDVDRDGDLDAVLGNWYFGGTRGSLAPPIQAQNFLFRNTGRNLEGTVLPGMTGETLAILLSDWTGDDVLDLIVGNDFDPPDIYLEGEGDGSFREIFRQSGRIPVSTAATMSIDTGDIDNDLEPEIYLTNIAARPSDVSLERVGPPMAGYCLDIEDASARSACDQNMPIRARFAFGGAHQPSHVQNCEIIGDPMERVHCEGMMLMKTAILERDRSLCEYIPEEHGRGRFLCEIFFLPEEKAPNSEYMRAVPQTRARNVMLMREGAQWKNRAGELGVEKTGWSWAGKFGDLNNDEWQDIYVVNGTWLRPSQVPSNIYYENQQGLAFTEKAESAGLEDFLVVSAFTYADIDRDGDLDIVTNSVNGPFRVYKNNEAKNSSMSVELRDYRGNRFGIGSKVFVHYAGEERHQVREIKSGSGFLSFDEPVAHFGLGGYESVDRIEVIWSTGEETVHPGPFQANLRYRIERR